MMMQMFDLHMDAYEHGLDALSMSRGCLYFLLLLCYSLIGMLSTDECLGHASCLCRVGFTDYSV